MKSKDGVRFKKLRLALADPAKLLSFPYLQLAVSLAGGTLDGGRIGHYTSYNIDAPDGKQWSCCSLSAIKVEWRIGDAVYANESIRDVCERLAYGLEDADEEDCCEEMDEDVCSVEIKS